MLLTAVQSCALKPVTISLFIGVDNLPIFNPDLEDDLTPEVVLEFCKRIDEADAVIIACPEYVRAIPGGLKNAIDWLVSRDEIISKPVALVHASHRGDDMLASLRIVLATVTDHFAEKIFLRIPLSSTSQNEAEFELSRQENVTAIDEFLERFRDFAQSD